MSVNHKNSASGFSLIEMLIAIGIIAMIAAISTPFYRSFVLNMDLKAAARDLASDLRYAQQQAVTTQINQQVFFYPSQNYYNVINASTSAIIKTRRIQSPITIQSVTSLPSNTVTYIPTGAATSSGIITLINSNFKTSTVEIKPSGYVEIR